MTVLQNNLTKNTQNQPTTENIKLIILHIVSILVPYYVLQK